MSLEQQHQFDDIFFHRRSYTAGVAFHQILLKSGQFVARDVLVTQRTEPRCDAIYRHRIVVGLMVQIFAAMRYLFAGIARKHQLCAILNYLFYQVVGQF